MLFRLFRLFIAFSLFSVTLTAQEEQAQAPNISAVYSIEIDAPIEEVWQALAVDYGGIGKWAAGVNHVIEAEGEGLHAERACEINATGFNDTRERIIAYAPERHYFAYSLYEGLPGFVKYAINEEQLESRGTRTLLTSSNKMYVGGAMGSMMKGFMTKSLNNVLAAKAEELKYYIEHGRPHPRKLAAMAKQNNNRLFILRQTIDVPAALVWRELTEEFPNVADSSPLSPKSVYTDGATAPVVGARRIMYKSANLKKYFKDEIVHLDTTERAMSIDVIEAKGFPNSYTRLDFYVTALTEETAALEVVFTYRTKPRFLGKLIKGAVRKDIQGYLYGLDHHLETGEIITADNWPDIRKNYY